MFKKIIAFLRGNTSPKKNAWECGPECHFILETNTVRSINEIQLTCYWRKKQTIEKVTAVLQTPKGNNITFTLVPHVQADFIMSTNVLIFRSQKPVTISEGIYILTIKTNNGAFSQYQDTINFTITSKDRNRYLQLLSHQSNKKVAFSVKIR